MNPATHLWDVWVPSLTSWRSSFALNQSKYENSTNYIWCEEVLGLPVLKMMVVEGVHAYNTIELKWELDPSQNQKRERKTKKGKQGYLENKQRGQETFFIKYETSLNSQHSNWHGKAPREWHWESVSIRKPGEGGAGGRGCRGNVLAATSVYHQAGGYVHTGYAKVDQALAG